MGYHSHSHNSGLFPWNFIPLENSCECNVPTEDGQNIPSSWKMDRTLQNQPRTDNHYLSVIGINFPTPSSTTSSKIRKTLMLLWRMRFQGNLQYGSIPLLTFWGHDHTTAPGIVLRHWVHFQGVYSLLDLLSWDPEELKAVSSQQVYHQDDQGQYIHLRTNQVKQMYGLITYMKHIFESYNSGLDLPMTHSILSHLMNGHGTHLYK